MKREYRCQFAPVITVPTGIVSVGAEPLSAAPAEPPGIAMHRAMTSASVTSRRRVDDRSAVSVTSFARTSIVRGSIGGLTPAHFRLVRRKQYRSSRSRPSTRRCGPWPALLRPASTEPTVTAQSRDPRRQRRRPVNYFLVPSVLRSQDRLLSKRG